MNKAEGERSKSTETIQPYTSAYTALHKCLHSLTQVLTQPYTSLTRCIQPLPNNDTSINNLLNVPGKKWAISDQFQSTDPVVAPTALSMHWCSR